MRRPTAAENIWNLYESLSLEVPVETRRPHPADPCSPRLFIPDNNRPAFIYTIQSVCMCVNLYDLLRQVYLPPSNYFTKLLTASHMATYSD